jgi:hypothetical protein
MIRWEHQIDEWVGFSGELPVAKIVKDVDAERESWIWQISCDQAAERLVQANRASRNIPRCTALCRRVLGEVADCDRPRTRRSATRPREPGPGGLEETI